MYKKFAAISLVALLLLGIMTAGGCSSCSQESSTEDLSTRDYSRIDSFAGVYARMIVSASSNSFEFDRTLLEVQARRTALAEQYGESVAIYFRKQVEDSLRVISPDVYSLITH